MIAEDPTSGLKSTDTQTSAARYRARRWSQVKHRRGFGGVDGGELVAATHGKSGGDDPGPRGRPGSGQRMARLTVTLTSAVFLLVSGQSASPGAVVADDEVATCFGQPATIVGTDGDDELVGTPGPDVIAALGGDDHVIPDRGDDWVCGGDGNDRIGDPDDERQTYRQSGDDTFSGGAGNDILGMTDSDGEDRLYGEDGDDVLVANIHGHTRLVGGSGNDKFESAGGQFDFYFGGDGDDSWRQSCCGGGGGLQRFIGNRGNDTATLNRGDDHLEFYGNRGNDTFNPTDSSASFARLDGGSGDDYLNASLVEGDAVLLGGPGRDMLVGGSGDQRATPTGGARMYGGTGPDTLVGTFIDDHLFGGDGADLLRGLGGKDVEYGGAGPDVLAGHQGADELHGGPAADTLYGHRGNDALFGGTGVDANYGSFGSDLCRSPSQGPRAHSCER